MHLQGKRILVTGADGFIGSHLTEELVRRGHKVRAFVYYNSFNSWGWLDESPDEIKASLDVFAGDVRDPHGVRSAMKDIDVVFHLAALIAIPYSYHSPDTYVDTNVKGTLNIVQAGREMEVERVVHTSTSEVYGTARFVPITEEHPLQPQSPYSASKIGADQMALSFFHSFKTPVTVCRPFNTYGPRQSARAVIPTIIAQLLAQRQLGAAASASQPAERVGATQAVSGAWVAGRAAHLPPAAAWAVEAASPDDGPVESPVASRRTRAAIKLGAVTPTRDFNYVADTVDGFIRIAECDACVGSVTNLGTGDDISIGETARLIAGILGVELEIQTDEARLRPAGSEVERLQAGADKVKRLTGWRPQYAGMAGLERGLRETVEWFSNPANLRRYKAERYNV
jgi:NAD dependent epimerase/dehydratase